MNDFVVTDQQVQAAFDWLKENTQATAAARAMRERREDESRAAKARAFLADDNKGSVAEREARAILTEEYRDCRIRYYEAVESDEYHREMRSKAMAIIDAWRTTQASIRGMQRIG